MAAPVKALIQPTGFSAAPRARPLLPRPLSSFHMLLAAGPVLLNPRILPHRWVLVDLQFPPTHGAFPAPRLARSLTGVMIFNTFPAVYNQTATVVLRPTVGQLFPRGWK